MLLKIFLLLLTISAFAQELRPVESQSIASESILTNGGFESGKFGWTIPNGVSSVDSTTAIRGKNALKVVLTSQALSITQDSTKYAAQFADGVQGIATVRVKTSVQGVKFCSRRAGVTSTSLCVSHTGSGKWELLKIPFIFGGTSQGLSLATSSAVTGAVFADDGFLGATDLKQDIDSSRIAGEAFFAGTTSCTWARTSTAIGSFGAVTACPGPTVLNASLGEWQTTDSNLPRVTINNLPAGKYVATFDALSFMTTTASANLSITDGTTTCEAQGAGEDTSFATANTVSCVFNYNNSGTRSFELLGSSSTSTFNIPNNLTGRNTKFRLEYFSNSSVYTSNNANTDWQDCGHTPASFTGFGSVTAIQTQCKRENGDLLMKGKFVVGAPTSVEARLSLPVWNGVQLTSKGSSVIPSIQLAGPVARSNQASTYFGLYNLIEPSVSHLTFGIQTSTLNALTKVVGSSMTSTGENISINARIPIEQFENSNLIIAQLSGLESCKDSYECTDVFSAKVSPAGLVSGENLDWINGNASISDSSLFSFSFNSGVFSVAPNCVVTEESASTAADVMARLSAPATSTGVVVRTNASDAGTTFSKQAYPFTIICQKTGLDAVFKSARAVSSDQNIATPGIVNSVIYSAEIAANGTISSERGDFISGNCTNATTSVCTFNSGAFLSSPNCSVTSNGGTLGTSCQFSGKPSTSSSSIVCFNDAGANFTTSVIKTIICHGERQ